MNNQRRKRLSRRLAEAVLAGDAALVAALLRAGADPARGHGRRATPLYTAAVHGNTGIARLLLAAGAGPDTESAGDGTEGTPLCAAACWGHTAVVRVLLEYGADPDLREDHGAGLSPLDWAHHGPHPGTVALLVAAGARETTSR